jgi:large subunit ribosomal protein L1
VLIFSLFRSRLKLDTSNKHVDDSWKAIPEDDAYVGKYYRWRLYTVADAIQCHKETHHPSMYNVPNAPLVAHVELNMKGEKATRFVENFFRMAPVQNKFDHGEERTILVFTKGQENLEIARNAGATHVGGPELVKDIQNGDLQLADYQYVVAHPNVLPDLVPIRGLMKKKFPNPKNGSLGANLEELVTRFMNGIQYSAMKDEHQNDFGLISTIIGTLNMDPKHLEENLVSLLKDVDLMRPKRDGKFITRVLLKSPPSSEQLKIDPFIYVPEGKKEIKKETKVVKKEVKDDDDDEPEAKEAVN